MESLQQLVGGELESEGWAPVAVQGLLSQPTAAAVSGVLQVGDHPDPQHALWQVGPFQAVQTLWGGWCLE